MRNYKKKFDLKGKRAKESSGVRASSPSNDETLAHRLEKTKFSSRCQKKDLVDKGESGEDTQEQGTQEDIEDKFDVSSRPLKGMHGNLGAILKEIRVMKGQMQTLGREMQDLRTKVMHASKIARGERTLGQRIDRLMEVVGSVEDVKKLMMKIS